MKTCSRSETWMPKPLLISSWLHISSDTFDGDVIYSDGSDEEFVRNCDGYGDRVGDDVDSGGHVCVDDDVICGDYFYYCYTPKMFH
mmetsp:Transcript_8106/g.13053  ORF Transcript_8106/g.13053 Transcript_8106/m.13053 type:complete len:86 (+) Transcript_8106:1475-1732(+)